MLPLAATVQPFSITSASVRRARSRVNHNPSWLEQVFVQCQAARVHPGSDIYAEPAHVPGLVGVAGDRLRALGIADDESVLPAVGADPVAFGCGLETLEPEAVAGAGKVRSGAELVFAVARVGARALGVFETTGSHVLLEGDDLLVVAAVAAGSENLEPGCRRVCEHAFQRLGRLRPHELPAARRNGAGKRDEIRGCAIAREAVLLIERCEDVAAGDQ